MPITRTPIIDDDGTGTTGTPLDNAWKTEFYNQIDAALLGGGQVEFIDVSAGGNFVLGAAYSVHILNSGSANVITVTWTGGSGQMGERVFVTNRGSGVVKVPHATAPATNILNIATSAPTPIGFQGVGQWMRHSGVYWVLVTHEQGAWITAPYNAADFFAPGGSSFGVDAGDISSIGYHLRGNTMSFAALINTASVGGTATANLYVGYGQYGGFQTRKGFYAPAFCSDNGANKPAIVVSDVAANALRLLKLDFSAWATSVNNSQFSWSVVFEVV